jgi:hypothetical protein
VLRFANPQLPCTRIRCGGTSKLPGTSGTRRGGWWPQGQCAAMASVRTGIPLRPHTSKDVALPFGREWGGKGERRRWIVNQNLAYLHHRAMVMTLEGETARSFRTPTVLFFVPFCQGTCAPPGLAVTRPPLLVSHQLPAVIGQCLSVNYRPPLVGHTYRRLAANGYCLTSQPPHVTSQPPSVGRRFDPS